MAISTDTPGPHCTPPLTTSLLGSSACCAYLIGRARRRRSGILTLGGWCPLDGGGLEEGDDAQAGAQRGVCTI